MSDFIIEYKYSIPEPLCDKIIKMFETQDNKHKGITASGIYIDIKDTTDFIIPIMDEKWNKVESFLYKELFSKIKKYIKTINQKMNLDSKDNYNIDYNYFENTNFFTEYFMIQKYNKNIGKYVYHNDFLLSDTIDKSFRVITFIWYLNNVKEGGETVFWNNYKINPEKGKLVLFPACWSYPHTGKVPISSDKYIITGWLFIKN